MALPAYEKQLQKVSSRRPRLWNSPEELEARIEAYKAHCEANKQPFTMSGLAVMLGCSRRTLVDYAERDEFLPTIKRARSYAESWLETYLLSGRPPIGAIFIAKNNFGWKDKSEIDHNHRFTMAEILRRVNQTNDSGYIEGELAGSEAEILSD